MALRFLADHCISNSIIQTLRDAHHEVLRLKDLLPVGSRDDVVLAKAQEIDAILLSLNGDFADIVTYPPKRHHGIVALQMRNHPETTPQYDGQTCCIPEPAPRFGALSGQVIRCSG